MKRSPMPQSTKPMKRSGFAPPFFARGCRKTLSSASEASVKPRKSLKAKQRAVTAEEKTLWNRMATEIGCIACWIDGVFNSFVSIHHIDGRTKPGCHKKVLPVCAPHHQRDDSDPAGRISIHPDKKRFEQRYGSQYDLLAMVLKQLGAPNA